MARSSMAAVSVNCEPSFLRFTLYQTTSPNAYLSGYESQLSTNYKNVLQQQAKNIYITLEAIIYKDSLWLKLRV
jgi:hypothetical protein